MSTAEGNILGGTSVTMMPGGVGIRNHADTQPGFGEAQLYILLSTDLLHREQ